MIDKMKDDELDNVAGGWCWTSHGCHYVISHSDKVDPKEDCFSDYVCFSDYYIRM